MKKCGLLLFSINIAIGQFSSKWPSSSSHTVIPISLFSSLFFYFCMTTLLQLGVYAQILIQRYVSPFAKICFSVKNATSWSDIQKIEDSGSRFRVLWTLQVLQFLLKTSIHLIQKIFFICHLNFIN